MIPANSFAEYAPREFETRKDVVWFALNADRPLFAFAAFGHGGDRGASRNRSPDASGLPLTRIAERRSQPIHAEAMPVILTTDEERGAGG